MQSRLGHIQFNVKQENLAFYKNLLSFLGWQTIFETDGMFGMYDSNKTSLWFVGNVKDVQNDFDGPGMNHLAIHPQHQADVDATVAYLNELGVASLFETPRHRPEFSGEGSTYYQVMFTTPDNILLEVVYTGPMGG